MASVFHLSFVLASLILYLSLVDSCPNNCKCQILKGNAEVKCVGLSEIPQISEFPENVASFVIEGSNLPVFSGDSLPTNSLTALSLVDCQLSSINEDSFSSLAHLTMLDISKSSLSFDNVLPRSFASLNSLKLLRLRENHFNGTIPSDFLKGLMNLTTLDFSGNIGIDFGESEAFSGLNLEEFSCGRCGLTNVSQVMHAISHSNMLHTVHLSRNHFPVLDSDSFSTAATLEVIDLSNCGIEIISPDTFSTLQNLKVLNLTGNRVSAGKLAQGLTLSSAASKGSANIYLEGNGLTTLPVEVGNLSSVGAIYLGNNPWKCDCGIAWMRTVQDRIVNATTILCVTPVSLAGETVVGFALPTDCRCFYGEDCGSSTAVVLGVLVPVLIISIVMLACFICRCLKTRRRRNRESKAFRYSAVYRETVELSTTKPPPLIDDMRI